MPRGGGRGGKGGLSRGRPPPAVRNAMAELGKGSLQSYEMLAQAAARSNVDAARGYFPELESGKKALPKPLLQSEIHIVKLWQEIQQNIQSSPHYIQSKGENHNSEELNGWSDDLWSIKQYYFMGNTTTKKEDTENKDSKQNELWDDSDSWFISELLPAELMPKKKRFVKKEMGQVVHRTKKRKRMSNGISNLSSTDLNDLNHTEEEDIENEDNNEEQPVVEAHNDDDDDLELDADYQTGIKFDDDEGYEENDSGAEEATF